MFIVYLINNVFVLLGALAEHLRKTNEKKKKKAAPQLLTDG